MKTTSIVSVLVAAGFVAASPAKAGAENGISKRASLPTIKVNGNAFYSGDKRFYIRGLDYQPGGNDANMDPLADEKICTRDIKLFKELGINTVRVYIVDNSKDHSKCMNALADAGIYLVVDVNNSKYAINRKQPYPSYNAAYLQNVFATVEMFSKFDNTLAFFSGNEVINDIDTAVAAPYVKAVTRDIKNYMNMRGLRKVPVGYSAADVAENRLETAAYMNCGTDDMRSDFFAFNDYSWCNTDFQTSDWNIKVKNFTDYGLPIFLSEYGCNKNLPRKFDEMSALMSKDMTGVYSGGLMFEYTWETNEYGIVDIKNGEVSKRPEFDNFKNALSKNPAPSGDGGASSKGHSSKCPAVGTNWNVDPEKVPSMPKEAEKYMKSGAGTGKGLSGDGSMDSKDSGTSPTNVTGGTPSPSSKPNGESAGTRVYGNTVFAAAGISVLMAFGAMML